MDKDAKIVVFGHNGMVGSAIIRNLELKGYTHIIKGIFDCNGWGTADRLDLTNQEMVNQFFDLVNPEYVFLAAAKVGGIYANSTYPADFIYNNLMIQNNVIHASYKYNVKKLMFLGSSCIYPRDCDQPMMESDLLTGPLEPTNEPYAIAKIAGIRMCQAYKKQYNCNFLTCQPTNLYGPGDNYDEMNSHVIPATIKRVHNAKVNNDESITVWGTGTPLREFMYVDDMADACVFLMENYNSSNLINVGSGEEFSIKEMVEAICRVVGYRGNIKFDKTKPDGTPRKLLNTNILKFNMGWQQKYSFEEGLQLTYEAFLRGDGRNI